MEPTEDLSPPSEEAAATVETEVQLEEPDFSELVDFVESEQEASEDEPLPVAATEAEEEVVPPVETPPEETPAEPVVKAEEEESQVEPVVEEAVEPVKVVEEEPAPEVKMPTKEELMGMYTEHRTQTLPTLEKLYALTDEQAEAYNEDPVKALPKIAASLHYDAMMSSYNAVMAALPSVIHSVMKAGNAADKAENAFYGEWPELTDAKHAPAVEAAVRAYRTTKPDAPLDEVIKNAGGLAMMNLGMTRALKVEEPKPKPKPRAKPATPIAPSGANAAPPVQTEEDRNIFSDLTEDFQNEFS